MAETDRIAAIVAGRSRSRDCSLARRQSLCFVRGAVGFRTTGGVFARGIQDAVDILELHRASGHRERLCTRSTLPKIYRALVAARAGRRRDCASVLWAPG